MEKTLRVLGASEESRNHPHSHSHSHPEPSAAKASGVEYLQSQDGVRKRSSDSDTPLEHESPSTPQASPMGGPSKLSAYLNLFGDFVHNM